MALKDWKLEKTRRGLIKWVNLYKQDYIVIVKDNEKGVVKPWRVQIHEGGSMFYTSWRGFKTKTEALAYAKAYMRSH